MQTVRIAQAQVLANTNATGGGTATPADAQAVASSLLSAFAAVPASDRAALKAEAEYVLAALGSDGSLGAAPAANTTIPVVIPTNTVWPQTSAQALCP